MKREEIIRIMLEKGAVEVKSKTSKYRCFALKGSYYFIGKKGAVRKSNKNAITESYSITAFFNDIKI